MGIEPTSSAWKAEVIPLYDTRQVLLTWSIISTDPDTPNLVEGGGFEPPKAEPSDLQSDPFGHSGTPPNSGSRIFCLSTHGLSTKNGPFPSRIWAVFYI